MKLPPKRVGQIVVVLALLAVALYLGRLWPREQTFRFVLGDSAPDVSELTVRYATAAGEEAEDWTNEARFSYAPPAQPAPRVASHIVSLANGDYTVEIDLTVHVADTNRRNTVRRRVTLSGGTTQIDLSQAVPK